MLELPDFVKRQILVFVPKDGDKISYNNDNLVIKDKDGKVKYQCTCYQIFSLFVIGNVSITSGVIMRAERFKYSVCLMNTSLRTYHIISNGLEGNTLLHEKQYSYKGMEIAKFLITNKIENQRSILNRIRHKVPATKDAINRLDTYITKLNSEAAENVQNIMGIEGAASRVYFSQVFSNTKWGGRRPRTKCDYVNTCLDIGYSVLFNFIECLLQLYGFDVYYGVLHRCFYMRKSLVCDIQEPFRPIIDWKIRCAINLGQINENDFERINSQYVLKYDRNAEYVSLFIKEILEYKEDIFRYVQRYYRCFMKQNPIEKYSKFEIK